MVAIDDVEIVARTHLGTRTISVRNKTRDKAIAAVICVGGACDPSQLKVTVNPLEEVQVGSEGPLDRTCAYEIESAAYLT